jgi:hypothetical protein
VTKELEKSPKHVLAGEDPPFEGETYRIRYARKQLDQEFLDFLDKEMKVFAIE